MEGYETNQYMTKLSNRMNIDLVIDVGGNAEQFRDILRNHVGYTGDIISFEPVPELAQNLALPLRGWHHNPRQCQPPQRALL
jgi:hypothetical protein